MISNHIAYIYFTGYAIIQLPDLLLFLYERLKKIKGLLTLRRSNAIIVMEQNNAGLLEKSSTKDINQQELEVASDRIDVINRLIKIEKDTIILFEKIERITNSIDSGFERQIKMSTDIDSLFKRFDRMAKNVDRISRGLKA